MPLIPRELLILIVALVVIPSITTILLRRAFYKYLFNQANQVKRLLEGNTSVTEPQILQTLKIRFQSASKQLENVNTTALIDQIYSQEKFHFIFKSFRGEQIDYFCRLLPNLLLTFGLLGTFLGITLNLNELNQVLNQTNTSNVSELVRQLQRPLQGMAIAFITSLTGLLFSAILTIFNFIYNTNLVKNYLINSLEDYLDNVYQSEIEGHSRLDQAVNRMVAQQEQFLIRFHENVTSVMENSLGKAADRIVTANQEANNLAKQIYERFTESSGTIATAANNLEHTIVGFENSVAAMMRSSDKFEQTALTFEQSKFPEKLSHATTNLANTQSKFSESASGLADTVIEIGIIAREIQNANQQLIKVGSEVSNLNQASAEVLDLHRNNQESLSEIIPQIQIGSQGFQLAVTELEKLQQQIEVKSDSLTNIQIELQKLIANVSSYTEGVTLGIESVGDRISENITKQVEINKLQIQLFSKTLQQCVHNLAGIQQQLETQNQSAITLTKIQTEIKNLTPNISQYTESVNLKMESVGDRISARISQKIENNQPQIQTIGENLQKCVNNLSEIKQQLSQQNQQATQQEKKLYDFDLNLDKL